MVDYAKEAMPEWQKQVIPQSIGLFIVFMVPQIANYIIGLVEWQQMIAVSVVFMIVAAVWQGYKKDYELNAHFFGTRFIKGLLVGALMVWAVPQLVTMMGGMGVEATTVLPAHVYQATVIAPGAGTGEIASGLVGSLAAIFGSVILGAEIIGDPIIHMLTGKST